MGIGFSSRTDLTGQEWEELLSDKRICSENDLRLLVFMAKTPKRMATCGQLTRMMGAKSHVLINGQVGRLGKRICAVLNLPKPDANVYPEWWSYLFSGEPNPKEGYYWIMSDSLYDAVIKLDGKSSNIITYVEGAMSDVEHMQHQRNREAREACIRHFGQFCQICGFDFCFYGDEFKGLIHVHHVTPISSKLEEREIRPDVDLIPVCPNCHLALHAKTPPYTPDELKKLIKLFDMRQKT